MILACGVVNVEYVLQDVQGQNKHEDTNEADDRHVGKRSRHDLTSGQATSSDLAVPTGKSAARARTTIVTKQGLADTVVLAGDIHTVVHHRLAARVRPSFGALASKLAHGCVEASA